MRRVGVGAEKPGKKSMADIKLKEEIKVLRAENEQWKVEKMSDLQRRMKQVKVPEKK